jgi:YVTN family beta-propeller protein
MRALRFSRFVGFLLVLLFSIASLRLRSADEAVRAAGAEPAATPRPALVFLSKDTAQLEVVDPSTLQIMAKIGTGPIPHEVAVSSDGKIAVTTNYGAKMDGTTLSVIDLDAQKEIHRVSLIKVIGPQGEDFGELIGPHGVEFFDGKFYFTAEGSKKIARYDPATDKVDWTHEIGQNRTHMLVIAKKTHTIYTSNVNSNSVTAVEESRDGGHWTNTVIQVGKGPEGIDISPNGKEVWAANSDDGTVSVIDTEAKKVTDTIQVGTKHSNRVRFTRDGKLVLISDMGAGNLIVVDAQSHKIVKQLPMGGSCEGILLQPGTDNAFVAVSSANKIAIVDLKQLTITRAIQTDKDPDGMAWRN